MGIEVRNFSYQYVRGMNVLENISFEIENGSYVCMLGPNGVGKSTLFKCMLGILTKYSGEIIIDGKNIQEYTPRQLAKKVAYIPQETIHSFNYLVSDIVLMGTTSLTSSMLSPGKKERALVQEALETLNIPHLENRMFLNLSGGERQLVLIARALAQQANILFMDEPTANLDYGHQIRVQEKVRELAGNGYTIIQSTHSPDQVFMYADSVMAIKDRKIEVFGPPRTVITDSLIHKLYGIDTVIESVRDDAVRVCIPKKLLDKKQGGSYL